MRPPRSNRLRLTASVSYAVASLFVASRDDGYRSPTAAPFVPPQSFPQSQSSTFVSETSVLSTTGAPSLCGEGNQQGVTISAQRWFVLYNGEAIQLNLEQLEVDYNGTLKGRSFAAGYRRPGNSQAMACELRESSISGTFSDGFDSFEAQKTQVLGPP